MQPPQGYGYPPAPKPKGPSLGLVVALCAVGAFFVVIPMAVGAYFGFTKVRRAKSDPALVVLSERHATQDDLLVAHYPADFGAKKVDAWTIIVSRKLLIGDELVTLGVLPIDKAATDSIDEFARLMLVGVEKNVTEKGGTSSRGTRRETKCLGKYDGVEYEPTFTLPPIGAYVGKACFFLHQARLHMVRYDVVKSQAEKEVPLLAKIVAATEVAH